MWSSWAGWEYFSSSITSCPSLQLQWFECWTRCTVISIWNDESDLDGSRRYSSKRLLCVFNLLEMHITWKRWYYCTWLELFFGPFNKFVRTKVLSFLNAAIWVLKTTSSQYNKSLTTGRHITPTSKHLSDEQSVC